MKDIVFEQHYAPKVERMLNEAFNEGVGLGHIEMFNTMVGMLNAGKPVSFESVQQEILRNREASVTQAS